VICDVDLTEPISFEVKITFEEVLSVIVNLKAMEGELITGQTGQSYQ
jgi:hypothetical protein